MSTSRPFAYNPIPPNSLITGTLQVGNQAVGVDPTLNYAGGVGGVQWWMGPDEDLGYVIAQSVPTLNQPNPLGISAGIGFFRSQSLTEPSFISIANYVSGQSFLTGDAASTWLTSNGYWNSWVASPTFTVGYASTGSTSDVFLFDSGLATKFTPSQNGTINKGYALISDNDYSLANFASIAVYSDNSGVPGSLLLYASSPVNTTPTPSWLEFNSFVENVSGSLNVTGGTPIWIAVWANFPGSIRAYTEVGDTNQTSENTSGTFTWSTWGATWNNVSLSNRKLSVYLECTAT